ncbi:MAG: hypothetical protein Q7K43_03200 [Candidatus Woesearchaeota archaeon]|nr:hypothetical protein [Candidatus Woesearchaeota archaeon]
MRNHIIAAIFLAVLLTSVVALNSVSDSPTGSVPAESSVVDSPQEFWPGLILGVLAIFVISFFVIKPTEHAEKKKR